MNKNTKIVIAVLVVLIGGWMMFGGSGDNGKITVEEAQQKMMELGQKVDNGELSQEEAMKQMEEINSKIEKGKTGLDALKDQQDNVSDFNGVPQWAKDLGALEPEGLTLVPARSSTTEEDASKHMNEDFYAYYHGTPEKLMSEARRLIKALNGKINTDQANFLLANGDLPGNHSLSITVRTDIEPGFLGYSILGRKKF